MTLVSGQSAEANSSAVPAKETAAYLTRDGKLSFEKPAGGDAHVEFTFDPANPCPTAGGNNLTIARGPMKPVAKTSTLKPGGTDSLAPAGLSTRRGKLRAAGESYGAGSLETSMRCARQRERPSIYRGIYRGH